MSRKYEKQLSHRIRNLPERLPRRSFLVQMGLAGAGAYFLPSLLPRTASAQTAPAGTPPKRLLVFFTQHGNPYYDWSMRPAGLPERGEWEFDLGPMDATEFSPILAPLYGLRNKLLVLDTLSNPAALEIKGGGGGHFAGPASVLTGSTITTDKQNRALGPSIDQIVAKTHFVTGGVRSIELGIGTPYPAIWAGPNNSLPVSNAREAFDRVFAGRNLDPIQTPPPTTAPPALTRDERIALARRSILDHTRARYLSLASKITHAEKVRLENHADLIGDLAATLVDPNAGGGMTGGSSTPVVSAGCYMPDRPVNTDYAGNIGTMSELVAAAFACDITRVASIQVPQMPTDEFGGPAGADVHQDIAHHGDQTSASYKEMVKYYRRHSEHFMTLISALDSIEEPDGSRVLDHTIVLWALECGSWVHQTSHMPIILAGGAGFRMGRYLHWGDIDAPGGSGGNGGNGYANIGPAISQLLVSVAQQMGINTNQVGDVSSMYGKKMDGPLDRLV